MEYQRENGKAALNRQGKHCIVTKIWAEIFKLTYTST
jgi:hypothetical protein